jgi:hypothetical protein
MTCYRYSLNREVEKVKIWKNARQILFFAALQYQYNLIFVDCTKS